MRPGLAVVLLLVIPFLGLGLSLMNHQPNRSGAQNSFATSQTVPSLQASSSGLGGTIPGTAIARSHGVGNSTLGDAILQGGLPPLIGASFFTEGNTMSNKSSFTPQASFGNGQSVAIMAGFEGLHYGINGFLLNYAYPPDVQLAAGPNHIFEMVNVVGEIFNKQGGSQSMFYLSTFFNTGDYITDPRILYDTQSGKWFATILDETSTSVLLVVSSSSDPTSSWYHYTIAETHGYCPDQPVLGISDDKVAISVNDYLNSCSAGGSSFVGAEYWILNKAELLAGTSVNWVYFGPDASLFSVHPVQSLSSTSALYMVSTWYGGRSTLRVFTVTGVPTVSSVNVQMSDLSIYFTAMPVNATQAGTTNLVNLNDGRVLDAKLNGQNIWLDFNYGCVPVGDTQERTCARYIEVDLIGPSIKQDFSIGTPSYYYYYPAIGIDQSGDMVTVFGYSSSSLYPSLALTAQAISDSPNSVESLLAIDQGSGPENSHRYGDYFAAAVDPSNPAEVWVAGEIGTQSGWSTHVQGVSVGSAQVALTFSYQVSGGGTGFGVPTLVYTSGGLTQSSALGTSPITVYADYGSAWDVSNTLTGSSASERWSTAQPTSGVATTPQTITFTYYHQYSASFDYRLVGGGMGFLPPSVVYYDLGSQTNTQTGMQVWADAQTGYSFVQTLQGSTNTERWFSNQATGLLTSPNTILTTYYHQYLVSVSYVLLGGGSPSPPQMEITYLGSILQGPIIASQVSEWIDAGSFADLSNPLGGSSATERWYSQGLANATILGPTSISLTYYHQYALNLSSSIIGGGSPTTPTFYAKWFGEALFVSLASPTTGFFDAGSNWTVPIQLSGSTSNERWVNTQASIGVIDGPSAVSIVYHHQFYVAESFEPSSGGSISNSSGWYNSGNAVQLSATAKSGWKFEGWIGSGSGSYSGSFNQTTIQANGPIVENATFYPGLKIIAEANGDVGYSYGSQSGTVPTGTSLTVYAPIGTVITLDANPSSLLYKFNSWTPTSTGTSGQTSVRLESPTAIQASFSVNIITIIGILVVIGSVFLVSVFALRRRSKSNARSP